MSSKIPTEYSLVDLCDEDSLSSSSTVTNVSANNTFTDLSRSIYIAPNGHNLISWAAKRALTSAMEIAGPDMTQVLLYLQRNSNLPTFVTAHMLARMWKNHNERTSSSIPPLLRPTWRNHYRAAYIYFAGGDTELAATLYREDQDAKRRDWVTNRLQISIIEQKFGLTHESWLCQTKKNTNINDKKRNREEFLNSNPINPDFTNGDDVVGVGGVQRENEHVENVVDDEPPKRKKCFAPEYVDLSRSAFVQSSERGSNYLTWTAKRALTNAMDLVGPNRSVVLKYLRDNYNFPSYITEEMLRSAWHSHCVTSMLRRPKRASRENERYRKHDFNLYLQVANGDVHLADEMVDIDYGNSVRGWQANKQQIQRINAKFRRHAPVL